MQAAVAVVHKLLQPVPVAMVAAEPVGLMPAMVQQEQQILAVAAAVLVSLVLDQRLVQVDLVLLSFVMQILIRPQQVPQVRQQLQLLVVTEYTNLPDQVQLRSDELGNKDGF
jgi:chromate transport protein ChrA